ncbi:MAG: hypothetical protein KDA84_13340, partial [Planctomycetaceae bacterium]|nr:hypothetical protein [Planctomycetaceae bacterium]
MSESARKASELADSVFSPFARVLSESQSRLHPVEIGTVISVDRGTARLSGLPSVQADELLEFRHGVLGMAFNL